MIRNLFFLLSLLLLKTAPSFCQTICLNMIVKNESHVIERCLASVKDLIDYWVIVDTGSTDGTQAIIEEFMEGVPGQLHERPWVNFAHNRNEALFYAQGKGDYLLMIDADEELVFLGKPHFPYLVKDAYHVVVRQSDTGVDYKRYLLVNNHLDWKWKGVVHESLESEAARTLGFLSDVINFSYTTGDRSSDPDKYLKDAKLLEKALEEDPDNSRYVYYLAQSYFNVPDYPLALKYYQKRAEMGGWEQEVFFSFYCTGMIQNVLEMDPEVFLNSHANAFVFRPSRAEPLYRMANYYIYTKNYLLGYLVSKLAITLPVSEDSVFVERWIYEWGALLQFAECSFNIGCYDETFQAIQKLLQVPTLPEDTRKLLIQNLNLLK